MTINMLFQPNVLRAVTAKENTKSLSLSFFFFVNSLFFFFFFLQHTYFCNNPFPDITPEQILFLLGV